MKFVPDTNVLLHYRSFSEVDWKGLLSDERPVMVLPETVLKELDQKKFEGASAELRERARNALARIEQYLDAGPMPNGVTLRFSEFSAQADLSALGLNPTNQDHRILAELLAMKQGNPDDRVVLVTADTGMRLTAKARGVEVFSPPADWRRELKDSAAKEVEKLRRELGQLRDQLPDVRLGFRAGDKITERLVVSPQARKQAILSDEEISQRIKAKKELLGPPPDPMLLLAQQILGTPAEDIQRYRRDYERYLESYSSYLSNLQLVQRKLAAIFEVRISVVNRGRAVADDIDIWMHFPSDVEVLFHSELPEEPDEPEEPDHPTTILGSSPWPRTLAGFANIPPLTPVVRNLEPPRERGPKISPDNPGEVHYWLRRLKHQMNWELNPVFVRFREGEPHSFGVEYSVSVGNHPEPTEGTLPFVVEDQSQSPPSEQEL